MLVDFVDLWVDFIVLKLCWVLQMAQSVKGRRRGKGPNNGVGGGLNFSIQKNNCNLNDN